MTALQCLLHPPAPAGDTTDPGDAAAVVAPAEESGSPAPMQPAAAQNVLQALFAGKGSKEASGSLMQDAPAEEAPTAEADTVLDGTHPQAASSANVPQRDAAEEEKKENEGEEEEEDEEKEEEDEELQIEEADQDGETEQKTQEEKEEEK